MLPAAARAGGDWKTALTSPVILPPAMDFVPYRKLGSTPNIIVDGAPAPGTVLALSHWPHSGTPAELRRDTSAEIAFAYLDNPAHHVNALAVSNNHFDEDGLVGIFALVQPSFAQTNRDLLIDVAKAGDFGVYQRRQAARIVFTISAFANESTSPLDRSIFKRPYAELSDELYTRLLPLLAGFVSDVSAYEEFWSDEDRQLTTSENLFTTGQATIVEKPDLDLAVIRLPSQLSPFPAHRFTQQRQAECHPFAIHNRTNCFRLLIVQGRRFEFQYRYESWVQFNSKRPEPRIDLTQLADDLNQNERSGGRWVFDGVDGITPKLRLEGAVESSFDESTFSGQLEHHLASGRPAWNPYD
jgi:hypothetical protein